MIPDLLFNNITVDDISYLFNEKIKAEVLRLDQLHPIISGNKWFKLRFYLEEAKALNKKNIVTFGGAWSNHIVATAAICKLQGLKTIGIVRGEEPAELSSTLQKAKELGMKLIFISRAEYKDKIIPEELTSDEYYLINEGGFGEIGAKGASTILDQCKKQYTHYCCAVGTGTMLAGIVNAIQPSQAAIGISVLKNNNELEENVKSLVNEPTINWQITHDYHFGGYAKLQPELLQFMNDFYKRTSIPSDFVYTGKLFYGVTDLLKKGFFPDNSELLIIHSGGLQGNNSLSKGTLMF